MLWPVPWLEALGLLVVVFAAGNGIGFGLSYLSGPRKPRPGTSRPARRAMLAPEPAPIEPTAAAPPIQAPAASPVTDAPKPKTVVSTPTLQSLPQVAFTMKMRYTARPSSGPIAGPFGLSVTQPGPAEPPKIND